jgi:ketosteroid isomerase-like protein
MSEENVEVVRRAVDAINRRDIDAYLACCTEDIQLVPPNAQIDGSYEGPSGVRQFLADVEGAMPDLRLEVEGLESIGPDEVLAHVRATASGRTTGIDTGAKFINVYELANGRISRVRGFPDREMALRAAGLSE